MMDLKLLKQNCEKNGFEFIFVENKKEALKVAKEFFKSNMSVGLGGSVSVEECGIYDFLVNNKDLKVFNQYEQGIDMEENMRRRKMGMIADIYVTGTNALTMNGELVNCDGSGNRVAAQIFGSDKLLIVVGINKIVKDVDAGFLRIKEIAAIKNVERLNEKAIKLGKEPKYTIENISHKFTSISGDTKGRTTIILVNEELGY
ncbi:MAG: lactate utilization protein [Campylobacteraceae bacterium]|jgi:L-lactate utilization protein LutB|nr:lactate utilization protein [Campylobacteraceae bacterium]